LSPDLTMTKTGADWCIESLAHDVVRLEEEALRARHEAAVWRDLASVALRALWVAEDALARLQFDLEPERFSSTDDDGRNDDR
jgi:hypothetical protein